MKMSFCKIQNIYHTEWALIIAVLYIPCVNFYFFVTRFCFVPSCVISVSLNYWGYFCYYTIGANIMSRKHKYSINHHQRSIRKMTELCLCVYCFSYLKCRPLKLKCVSTMPVVLTRVRRTSCCVGM